MSGSAPLISVAGVRKSYGNPQPLAVQALQLAPRDRVSLAGLGTGAAEMLINLITGAAVPDEGLVRIAGQDTRGIETDTQWLSSLDRFGLVTHRAVLIEKLPVAANMALPLTLAIDPMTNETREAVERLAEEVGLPLARLSVPAGELAPAERLRVHLGRALALAPEFLLLEHPTAPIDRADPARADIGRTLRAIGERRGIGWLALTDDDTFAAAAGGRRLRLGESGRVQPATFWARIWRPGGA
jgi:predicted ABC-type transport system involved in lysophospholipase L1 biosynthesis ATPase subunit